MFDVMDACGENYETIGARVAIRRERERGARATKASLREDGRINGVVVLVAASFGAVYVCVCGRGECIYMGGG